MKVVIIGAGNVATHLAIALSSKVNIVQIFSRNKDNALTLANKIGGFVEAVDNLDHIESNADVYLISVKDDAIEPIVERVSRLGNNALWLHTSGSKSIDVFRTHLSRFGVLYPLQTFSKDVALNMEEVPFFIEGRDDETSREIKNIATLISNRVFYADSEKRRQMHIAAVFACNFANYLWTISDEILSEANLPFDVLLPLIKASVEKIGKVAPSLAQTGPAARGDMNIISDHLNSLAGNKKEIYQLLSESILNHKNNL
ncbi:MAG: DUF2520 domain-containing protein [Muribaculaceae bacterium]|nr:DUF2520 domain-containing protein [Muribaculaceae bacterium]